MYISGSGMTKFVAGAARLLLLPEDGFVLDWLDTTSHNFRQRRIDKGSRRVRGAVYAGSISIYMEYSWKVWVEKSGVEVG